MSHPTLLLNLKRGQRKGRSEEMNTKAAKEQERGATTQENRQSTKRKSSPKGGRIKFPRRSRVIQRVYRVRLYRPTLRMQYYVFKHGSPKISKGRRRSGC